MKKAQQIIVNVEVLLQYRKTAKEQTELFNFTSKPLRHCSAKVYKGNTGYFLKSYRTIIAYIPFNSNICYDFLRYVYGYTATSAQHIAKFARDYNADTILSYKDI